MFLCGRVRDPHMYFTAVVEGRMERSRFPLRAKWAAALLYRIHINFGGFNMARRDRCYNHRVWKICARFT